MVMLNSKHRLIFIFLLFALGVSETEAATIQAELDRNRVSLHESFTLVFKTEGEVDGEPDFKPIEQHFEIMHQMEGSRMEIINAKITHKKEWTLTLMGKDVGSFTIPSIAFGKDLSPPLRIDIEKKAPDKKDTPELLVLEVSATPETAYVQSQFIYTIRFYRAVNLLSAQISEPEVSDSDAVIEKLGEDRQFEIQKNGERYRVIERKYAIFPQQSGLLTISPVRFAGQLAGRARSQFNPFPGGGPIKRLRSDPVILKVKPVPQDKVKGRWLPAHGLLLMEDWPELTDGTLAGKVGEPLTWTLRLEAEGLTAAQIPEIEPQIPEGVKAYPDQPTLKNNTTPEGLTGIRQEKIALIPTQPGTLVLPGVEVPWWNTQKEQIELARLPERRLQIAPADIAPQPVPPLPAPEKELPSPPPVNISPAPVIETTPGAWPWVSFALALAWAITLIAWRTHYKSKVNTSLKPLQALPPDFGPVKKQLQKACMQNDTAAVKEALLAWGRLKWPGRPLSLGEIAIRTGPVLCAEIRKMNAVLYGQTDAIWEDGMSLWTAFKAETRTQKKAGMKEDALVPLYPNQGENVL